MKNEIIYRENNLNKSPYSEGFGEIPQIDFSSFSIPNKESQLPFITVQKDFSKLEEKTK